MQHKNTQYQVKFLMKHKNIYCVNIEPSRQEAMVILEIFLKLTFPNTPRPKYSATTEKPSEDRCNCVHENTEVMYTMVDCALSQPT